MQTFAEKEKEAERKKGHIIPARMDVTETEDLGSRKQSLGEVRVSVRNLVEFILRHGDIDNRRHTAPDNAMQEGGRIHRMIQRRMGAEYQAEVPLQYTCMTQEYHLVVEGRADGILRKEGQVVIDEIKGTYRELAWIREPSCLHLAQAKCYAYMLCLQEELVQVQVRITYCHIPTEELRYFHEEYSFQELEEWFQGLLAGYRRFAEESWQWRKRRQASIAGLAFPFPYREGQRELVVSVYRTIYHGRKLFLEAPTGVGKTISTLYPAIQAMGKDMGNKLFYLTAKTITRTVAEDTLALLRDRGLCLKSVILTAREKICFMEETECNPEYCPYARGHYDRINDAMYDLLTATQSFSREQIEIYALKHQVCPFELCLDMSLFADVVIGDYNYLFDPHVYLKRFFGEGVNGDYLFLIDEAHNLLERGREMYSAVLWKESFLEIRKEIKQTMLSQLAKRKKKPKITGQITLSMVGNMTYMSEKSDTEDRYGIDIDQTSTVEKTGEGRSVLVKGGYGEKLVYYLEKCNREMLALKRECEDYRLVEDIDGFVQNLMRLQSTLGDYLEEQEETAKQVRDLLLDFYYDVKHFLEMYELLDENYVKYTQLDEDGRFMLKLFCVNPRENLKVCMQRGRSSILFSATFLPIQYYKKLLGGGEEDYEIYARSVFNTKRRELLIANDVTTRYTRRSEEEYYNIARYIDEIVRMRHGNYMVFFPSYAFLRIIYDKYMQCFDAEDRICLLQGESMGEEEREAFLEHFRAGEEERFLIGFCVLGGIFGEGIDLKNDSLIGAIIVGTGLPYICNEREILRQYFEGYGEDGFDYAYRYPGMNKVLQAAGRVIRTMEDTGIIALLDQRFLQIPYRRLFPREWESFLEVGIDTVSRRVERFWDQWL